MELHSLPCCSRSGEALMHNRMCSFMRLWAQPPCAWLHLPPCSLADPKPFDPPARHHLSLLSCPVPSSTGIPSVRCCCGCCCGGVHLPCQCHQCQAPGTLASPLPHQHLAEPVHTYARNQMMRPRHGSTSHTSNRLVRAWEGFEQDGRSLTASTHETRTNAAQIRSRAPPQFLPSPHSLSQHRECRHNISAKKAPAHTVSTKPTQFKAHLACCCHQLPNFNSP